MFRCGHGCGGFSSWLSHFSKRFQARALSSVSLAVRPVVAMSFRLTKRIRRFSTSFSSSSSSSFSSSSISSSSSSSIGALRQARMLFHSQGFHKAFSTQSAKWFGKGSSIQSHYSQYCTSGSGCTSKSSCSKANYQYLNGNFFKIVEFPLKILIFLKAFFKR